jgi:3-oxoadipate enol-lactonase
MFKLAGGWVENEGRDSRAGSNLGRMTLSYDMAGQGPAVVLLHSSVCDRRMWDAQWQALADAGYQVVRCDFRGHGQTPADAGEYSDAGDVLELLDELGIQRAALVASSFGGRVALEAAARRPDRVTALALLCPGMPGHEPSSELRAFGAREDAFLDVGDVSAAVELNLDTWLGPQADERVREKVRVMQRHAFEIQLAADEAAQARASEASDEGPVSPAPAPATEPVLGTIEAPCLAVGGAHDVADFRRIAARLPQLLPGARHIELDWAGHLPSLERPDETTALLRGFLAEHLGGRADLRGQDVLDLLDLLDGAGVEVWLDGGWGVDALLGEQTRAHNDLDIAVRSEDADRYRRTMRDAGFRLFRDDGPHNFVLVDDFGRQVDVHFVDLSATRTDEHGARVYGPDGIAYPVGAFGATGTVLGRQVPCCTAEFQVGSHAGYELGEDDLRDVLALHRRFGVLLLPEHAAYASRLG